MFASGANRQLEAGPGAIDLEEHCSREKVAVPIGGRAAVIVEGTPLAARSHPGKVVDEADVLMRVEVMAGDSTRDARLLIRLLAVSHDLGRSGRGRDARGDQKDRQEESQRGTAHRFSHRSNRNIVRHPPRGKRFAGFSRPRSGRRMPGDKSPALCSANGRQRR